MKMVSLFAKSPNVTGTVFTMLERSAENLMFKTKKELRREIKELQSLVDELKYVNELPKNSGMQKCKNVMCKGCAHAVWISSIYTGPIIVGCDTSTECADFERLPSTSGDYYRQDRAY